MRTRNSLSAGKSLTFKANGFAGFYCADLDYEIFTTAGVATAAVADRRGSRGFSSGPFIGEPVISKPAIGAFHADRQGIFFRL